MNKVTRNEADFSELFEFAEKNYGISWNGCNNLFFHSSLTYQRYNDFDIEELESDLTDEEFGDRKIKTELSAEDHKRLGFNIAVEYTERCINQNFNAVAKVFILD